MSSSIASAWDFAGSLTSVATFYTRAASTGRATQVLQEVPCQVGMANFHDAPGDDRAALASARTLLWTADFQPPPEAQVEVNHDGIRWNIRGGTLRYLAQPDGALGHWECDLEGSGRPPRTAR